jgi:hypothetical protein
MKDNQMTFTPDEFDRIDEAAQIRSDLSDLQHIAGRFETLKDLIAIYAKAATTPEAKQGYAEAMGMIDDLLHDSINAADGALADKLDDLGDPAEEAAMASNRSYALWATGAVR